MLVSLRIFVMNFLPTNAGEQESEPTERWISLISSLWGCVLDDMNSVGTDRTACLWGSKSNFFLSFSSPIFIPYPVRLFNFPIWPLRLHSLSKHSHLRPSSLSSPNLLSFTNSSLLLSPSVFCHSCSSLNLPADAVIAAGVILLKRRYTNIRLHCITFAASKAPSKCSRCFAVFRW